MPKLSREHLQLWALIGILVVLAGVVGYQFVWRPMAKQRASGQAAPTARLQTDVVQLKRQLSQLSALKQTVGERQAQLARLEARFIKGGALDTTLADLSAMAQASQVRIESLEPLIAKGMSAVGSQGLYAEVPIQIWAKGGYHQLGAFLHAMERHPRLMNLVRLDISGNAETPWRQSAHVIVSTYQLIDGAQIIPVPATEPSEKPSKRKRQR